MTRPPLLAADIPWLLYRSFFALPKSITDERGRSVNALLGTVNAILGLVGPEGPLDARVVVACMGAEQAAYRVERYPPYHAHREPMAEALADQWGRAGELLAALGWVYEDSDTLEADDVMFSHACVEQEAGGEALLMTADRDLFGATGERVRVVQLKKGGGYELIGPTEVEQRYGIGPALVPDLIALRGDPSDGIPGAPGVGEKTAAALLVEHGSLEAALDAARAGEGSMRPRIAAALSENDSLLRDFKHIATLQRIDVERPPDRETDYEAGAAKAAEMGMRRLAKRLETLMA
ncbi:MAG TPA: 5'-3' exonuclease H3TH domain-containing protein [Solirubrobacteraceae bacterium]|jgi:DNA polymerase-1